MFLSGDLSNRISIGGVEYDLGPRIMQELAYLIETGEYQRLWNDPDVFAREIVERIDDFRSNPDVYNSRGVIDYSIPASLPCPWDAWNGLDLSHIVNYSRLYTLAALYVKKGRINQQILNFLTCRGVPESRPGLTRTTKKMFNIAQVKAEKFLEDQFVVPQEQMDFATGFIKDLIEEAEPFRKTVVLGEFVLERTPLGYLDRLIEYDHLRISFSPRGMMISIVNDAVWSPVFWSPEFDTCELLGGETGWALKILFASIWRDACVVKEKWVTERTRREYKPRPRQSKEQKTITSLPRVIRHVEWAEEGERHYLTRTAHAVRAFYRRLPDKWKTSKDARKTAKEFGYPAPPKGYTFVQPHVRGGKGEEEKHRQVVCRGLRTATIALNVFEKGAK